MSAYPKSWPGQPDLVRGLPVIFRALVVTPMLGPTHIEVRKHIGAESVIYMTVANVHDCKTFRVIQETLMDTIHRVANDLTFKGFEISATGSFVGLEKV